MDWGWEEIAWELGTLTRLQEIKEPLSNVTPCQPRWHSRFPKEALIYSIENK
jgi:hypothetical protein